MVFCVGHRSIDVLHEAVEVVNCFGFVMENTFVLRHSLRVRLGEGHFEMTSAVVSVSGAFLPVGNLIINDNLV